MIFKIPKWKLYLYSLAQRYSIYRNLILNRVPLGLSFESKYLMKKMLNKYVPLEIRRKNKYVIYKSLVESVLIHNQTIATYDEINLCYQILPTIKQIGENIMTELSTLRKFAKEVGISPIESAKIKDEKELIKTIIRNIDASGEYSKEFVAWYNDVDEDTLNEADALDENGEEVSGFAELIDLINSTNKKDDLLEIINDKEYKEIFKDVNKKTGLTPKLKKAMLDAIEAYEAENTDNGGDSDEVNEDNLEEVVNAFETEEDVEKFMETDLGKELFENIELTDDDDVDSIKIKILEAAGIEVVEKPKSKRGRTKATDKKETKKEKSKKDKKADKKKKEEFEFDPENFDPEEVMEHVNGLPYIKQKSFAKSIGLTIPVGTKADDVLEMIQTHLNDLSNGDDSDEDVDIEITEELVQEALDNEDVDTLMEMCEYLDIKVSSLIKKKPKKLAEKILEALEAIESEKEAEEEAEEETGNITVYATIEKMFLNGDDLNTIHSAVKDTYKELGVSILKSKKRVEGILQLMKEDYGK